MCLYTVKRLNISILPIDITLSGATIPDQSGAKRNGNQRVFHIPQGSRRVASPLDGLV